MTGIRHTYKIRARVWLYPGLAAWHFVTLPKKQSVEIKKVFGDMSRGFGSLKVLVTVGRSKWNTSIFPDKKAGAYLLPIKASVRKKENIQLGKTTVFLIQILV